jgi:hypothetical protein
MDVFMVIAVDNVDEVMQTYQDIRIFKAQSRHGTYTEITDSNTRIPLVHGIKEYVYHDAAGTPEEWYRSTYITDMSPIIESMPSDPRNFGAWGVLADALARRLMSEGNNVSLGNLYDAIFDASCDTIRVPPTLDTVTHIELSWLCRRATRHALATILNDYVAKPAVSKSTVNVSLQSSASSLMQRVRQMDEEWQTARQNDIRIFEGRMIQLQDSDKTFGMIVGEGYQIDPISGRDYTVYADTRVESIFDTIARW